LALDAARIDHNPAARMGRRTAFGKEDNFGRDKRRWQGAAAADSTDFWNVTAGRSRTSIELISGRALSIHNFRGFPRSLGW
jgi:hypothetical protein